MKYLSLTFVIALAQVVAAFAAQPASPSSASRPQTESTDPASRSFSFNYRFRVKGLKPANDTAPNIVRVWMPEPPSNQFQKVERLPATAPAKIQEDKEPEFGNQILYFKTEAPPNGEFTVNIPYEVTRHEVRRDPPQPPQSRDKKLANDERTKFLSPDELVPTTGKPLRLLDSVFLMEDELAVARQLYDVVDQHVVYKKEGAGWGRGDTNWVCDSGYGNCTDFHSLFISLARSQGLPARFEIGFSIPTGKTEGPVSGYHCWAWFYHDDRGWVPVDISEADKHPEMKDYYFGNLTADRVVFSTGRDLSLVPKAKHEPVNFFIYPHIEVDGKVLPQEHLELQFAFKDREQSQER